MNGCQNVCLNVISDKFENFQFDTHGTIVFLSEISDEFQDGSCRVKN